MIDKDLAQKAATLEKELRHLLGAVKCGWHENDEPEYTQRFGVAYIEHIERVLDKCKPCDHLWTTKNENGSLYSSQKAVCVKCGYEP
jgi:hypothetical protein